MSNERSSIFETFTVQEDDSMQNLLQQQVIPTPQFYNQQQNTNFIIQSPVKQQHFSQDQNLFSIQQDGTLQQFLPQQQQYPAFSSSQQTHLLQQQLIQQQLIQQKQIYQQKIKTPNIRQIQPLTFNTGLDSNDNDIVYLNNENNTNNPPDNTLFLNSEDVFINNSVTNDVFNNNSNSSFENNYKTVIINDQDNSSAVVQSSDSNTNNNFYDNSCNDFTGVEEVVGQLWMECESHEFNQLPEQQNVENDVMLGGEEKVEKKKKKKKKKKKSTATTSYSLFYRDTQLAIKEQRPQASVHEVTSIVDSMWKQLEDKHRAYYERMAETEKNKQNRLLKKDTNMETKIIKKKKKKKEKENGGEEEEEEKEGSRCRRQGCGMKAIDDSRWHHDYCSTQCVVSHCKNVFKAWVLNRKEDDKDVL